jgi:hypothetical protein
VPWQQDDSTISVTEGVSHSGSGFRSERDGDESAIVNIQGDTTASGD